MGDVGLAIERAEDKTAQMQARSGAIDELIASGALEDRVGGGGDDIDRELAALSSTSQVEAELAQLKAGIHAAAGHRQHPGPAGHRRRGPRRRERGRRARRPAGHGARGGAGQAVSRTRFVPDHGLTARMTATMFLLGGLFVVVIVGAILLTEVRGLALIIGVAALGFVWWTWWNSDKTALKAMRARVVTPQEAPELHAMIDRLCTLADMPKPTVAIAYTNLPNAFATGRNPSHSAVCVTTGILDKLTLEELEGVLAHELSHVAHRDVMVMSLAATAGIITGMVLRGAQFGGLGMLRRSPRRPQRRPGLAAHPAGQRGGLRHQLHRHQDALALPRAGRRPRRVRS